MLNCHNCQDGPPLLSLTTALQKPMGDVMESVIILYGMYLEKRKAYRNILSLK